MICRLYKSPQHDLVYKPCTIPSSYRKVIPVNLIDNISCHGPECIKCGAICRDFASVMKVWALIKKRNKLPWGMSDLTLPSQPFKRAQASPEIRESPAGLKEASSQELYCYKEMDCVRGAHRARALASDEMQTCKALRRGSNQTFTRFLTHRNCETRICHVLGQQA